MLTDDADIPLDVQAAFDATYDLLGYDLLLDYQQPPESPLNDADATWADVLLRTRGMRA